MAVIPVANSTSVCNDSLILDEVDQDMQMSLRPAVAEHENFRQIVVNASRQK